MLFNEQYRTFEAFSLPHLLAVVVIILLFLTIIFARNSIPPKADVIIRRSMAIAMIIMEWTFYGFSISKGGFQTSLLPFGVCAISMYATSFALWTKNERMFQIIFPWAIAGALISLVVADMEYTFPHFRYIHYFGNHGLFFLGNIYLLVVHRFSISYKQMLRSSLILFLYALIMYPINFLLDSNHLFLREIPAEVAPLYAGLGNFWIAGFVFSIFVLFNLLYMPVMMVQIHRNKPLLKETET